MVYNSSQKPTFFLLSGLLLFIFQLFQRFSQILNLLLEFFDVFLSAPELGSQLWFLLIDFFLLRNIRQN